MTSTEPHRLPRKGTPCVLRGEHARCRDAGHRAQDAKRHRERRATDPEYREKRNEAAAQWRDNPANRWKIFAASQRRTLRAIEKRIAAARG